MQRYQNNVQDILGNAVDSVTVTVRRVSDGAVASIFSDNSGTGKSNPFTNDSDGEFFFYAADDRYNIFLTGPITETISDVLLLDILTSATSVRVLTDIVTATPPVAELVSGEFSIYDLDESDQLARFGFAATSVLRICNFMHGANVTMEAEKAAGTLATLLEGDPDGAVDLYYDGGIRVSTGVSGALAVRSDGNTDAEVRAIALVHQDATTRGFFGYVTDAFLIQNQIHGGNVELSAEDAGGNPVTILIGDPDALTTLRADTDLHLEAAAGEDALIATANAGVAIYWNDILKFQTVDETATDQISGAEVLNASGVMKPVGLGVVETDAATFDTVATHTPFRQVNAGENIYFVGAGAGTANWDTYASTGASQTDIPNGTMWFVQQNAVTTLLAIRGGTGVTIRFWVGDGAAPADADVSVARSGMVTVRKVSDTVYDVWGIGAS